MKRTKSIYLNAGQFAEAIGVSRSTVISWDRKDLLKPHHYTPKGYRQYTQEQVNAYMNGDYTFSEKKEKAFLSSTEFAEAIGVAPATVVSWDKQDVLKPHHYTPTGTRQYSREQIDQVLNNQKG